MWSEVAAFIIVASTGLAVMRGMFKHLLAAVNSYILTVVGPVANDLIDLKQKVIDLEGAVNEVTERVKDIQGQQTVTVATQASDSTQILSKLSETHEALRKIAAGVPWENDVTVLPGKMKR